MNDPDQSAPLWRRLEACPLCGASSFQNLPLPSRWIGREVFEPVSAHIGLQRCRACGLELVNPRPGSQLLQAFYSCDSYCCHQADDSAGAQAKARHLLSVMERYTPGRSQRGLLDYGCGGGYMLRQARLAGWRAQGFDIGRAALESCQDQGLQATCDLEDLLPGSFDAVLLNHVFEHLEDHRSVLERLKPLLKPEGRLFVETPNVASLRARLSPERLERLLGLDQRHRAYPIHLSYFSTRTLPRMLETCGLGVEAVLTTGLGLEEMFYREEEPRRQAGGPPLPPPAPPAPPAQGLKTRVKESLKRAYFNLGLGENVLAVCRPRT